MALGRNQRTADRILAYLVAATILSGCGGIFGRIRGEAPFPEELPQDYRERFEVRAVNEEASLPQEAEGPSAAASPSPATVPTPASVAAKVPEPAKSAPATAAKKKSSRKASAADEVPPFSYPDRRAGRALFPVGEKHIFSISFFGMSAANVVMEVLPNKEINGRRVFHVHGRAQTTRMFSFFYTVDDTIETYMDQDGLFSHRFHIKLNETKQTRDSLELLDSEKGQSYWWDRWDHKKRGYHEKKQFIAMKPLSQDSLSALFYMRTLELKNGVRYEYPIMNQGKQLTGFATVLGRETIATAIGKLPAIKLKLDAEFQGIAKKAGDSHLWISDDERRLLLKLEARVKIGTITASIQDYKIEP